MLTLTDNATRAIGALSDRPGYPVGAGVRITRAESDDSAAGLSIGMAATPEDDDAVVEDRGARVFVESEAVDLLDDKMLDAEIDDGGRVRFMLGPQ